MAHYWQGLGRRVGESLEGKGFDSISSRDRRVICVCTCVCVCVASQHTARMA